MAHLGRIPSNNGCSRAEIAEAAILAMLGSCRSAKLWSAVTMAAIVLTSTRSAAADNIMATKAALIQYAAPSACGWSGFDAGGHLGYAWASSNWTGLGISGSLELAQAADSFDEAGSFFAGLQAGYNDMLPNRVVIGAEIDAWAPKSVAKRRRTVLL